MRVDLKNFINSDDVTMEFAGELDRYHSDYDTEDLNLILPIKYKGTVYDIGDELLLDLSIVYKYKTQCDRCLKPIVKEEESELEAYFLKTKQFDLADEADVQYFELENQEILLDDIIISQIITDRPLKNLCNENCLGLCPKCGKDLNEGPCECESEADIDPRFESLLDLFNDEEV
ncbi:YceD family protein [Peptoniphilus catoniae]|uniref:YceD family protein n=1 Tax=Peptoniphilus catoniae TaxID=1660341 RepID=UPI0010FEC64A|nr:YceD family protein [Peptoniphilus catoniae]